MKHEILVIESDPPLAGLIGAILKSRFRVAIRQNCISALSWLSEGNLPALIICGDFDHPDIDGLTFLQYLKRSGVYSGIPTIMLSSDDNKSFHESCWLAGASAVVGKPFDPLELMDMIELLFNTIEKPERVAAH